MLNADFRPLSTYLLSLVDARDAVLAVFRERVSMVEAWPAAFFRSPSISVAVPKVVALREYAPICGEPKFCRRSILLRDRFRCCYCGQRFEAHELTYDHVIPRSKGGTHRVDQHRDRLPRVQRAEGQRPAELLRPKGEGHKG